MAYRLILALIALLTGIAALGGPAHARLARGESVQADPLTCIEPARSEQGNGRCMRKPARNKRIFVLRPIYLAPTAIAADALGVLTGIDRARE